MDALHASLYAMYRIGNGDSACEALRQHILRGPFVASSSRCWGEAGKPWDLEGVYEGLGGPLRRAVTRLQRTKIFQPAMGSLSDKSWLS